MSTDILHLIPELAAIGQVKLQDYCSRWLQRPIAREYGIAQLTVDDKLMLGVNLDTQRAQFVDDRVFIPIDELLGYIIDQHFQDREERARLHAAVRAIRDRMDETGHAFEATIGRMGTLYLICRGCQAALETQHQAIEGQNITCPPCSLTCPACGHTDIYDGSDLNLMLDEGASSLPQKFVHQLHKGPNR